MGRLDFDSWTPFDRSPRRITGEWWVPGDSQNKQPGTLTLAPSKWPKLELEGTLLDEMAPDMNQAHALDAVRGRLETDEHLTLVDCAAFPELGFGERYYQKLDLIAERVFSGPYWVRPESARFETAEVQPAGLSVWTRPLGMIPRPEDRGEDETIVRYAHYEPLEAEVDDRTRVDLRCHPRTTRQRTQVAESWTLEDNFFFRITLDPAGPADRFADRIKILETFLAFCLQQPAPTVRWGIWRRGAERRDRYDVHKPVHVSRALESEPDKRDWLFALQHVRDRFEEILSAWFELHRENPDLVDLILEPVYSPELSASTEFLNIMRSLEALHGHIDGGKDASRQTNEAIGGPLEAALTQGLPDEARDCLRFRPSGRSLPSFVRKVRGVLDRAGSMIDDPLSIDDKALSTIKTTRDYYAHHDPSLQGGSMRYEALPIWNDFFRRVINLVTLDLIRVPPEDVRPWNKRLKEPLKEAESRTT